MSVMESTRMMVLMMKLAGGWSTAERMESVLRAGPCLQMKVYHMRPMEVAEHIHGASGRKLGDTLDFELDVQDIPLRSPLTTNNEAVSNSVDNSSSYVFSPPGHKIRMWGGKETHGRSHLLDGSGTVRHINWSETVGTLPYQKVYPQRRMMRKRGSSTMFALGIVHTYTAPPELDSNSTANSERPFAG